ncbi:MAG: DUF2336 domain-containing protein [Pseudomonadota bacterium]
MNWKQTADVAKRAAAASALARAYLQSDLPFEERCAAEAALTELTDDPSPRVRLALAEAIATSARAPEQIVVSLLRDRYDIASLIVARSPRVREVDLVERVRCGDPKLLLLIARRGEVGRMLALALSRFGSVDSVLAILGNSNAHVCGECRRIIADRFASDAGVRGALLEFKALEPVIRYKLVVAGADDLAASGFTSQYLGGERARDAVEAELQRSLLHIIARANGNQCAPLADALRVDGRLTTSLTIRIACHGLMDFLADVVAGLNGRSRETVIDAFAAARTTQLQNLLNESGFAASVVAILLQAIMKWRAVGQGRLSAGVQEITYGLLEAMETNGKSSAHDPANDDLEGLLRSIYLDAVRNNARSHARSVAQLHASAA